MGEIMSWSGEGLKGGGTHGPDGVLLIFFVTML